MERESQPKIDTNGPAHERKKIQHTGYHVVEHPEYRKTALEKANELFHKLRRTDKATRDMPQKPYSPKLVTGLILTHRRQAS